ncbi:hypothetical protein DH2020_005137 [Rehmannia glutinosa]|uniref:Uncharacterized protein n=1 Tax=Rehmannia glutinosa TaxID=99300 RepID=A0ABR0XRG8_REHGL
MAAATVVDAPSSWPKDVRPPIVSYTPSMWGDTFTSFTLDHQVQEKYAETIEALKQEARIMLMAERNTISEKLVIIDTFERLGVAYHFEQEIEELLEEILKFDSEEDNSLFTVALRFRLLRQHRHHASCLAKSIQILTNLDDTYDNYATLDEADLFTEIMQRCVTVKELCKAYNKELKWFMGEKMPSFEDYIANTMITSCLYVICSSTIPGMKSVTKETIDWMMSEPKIFKASAKVCRYLDDLGSFEREGKQGKTLTGVDFYMKQHGLSMQETTNKFVELTEDAWKDLNTEWMTKTSTPTDMVEQVLGYARPSEIFYRSCQDGFTNTEVVAPYVVAFLVDPIIM